MKISLSVLIVSYNSENFIEKCLISVLKNLPSGGEVIVLDNNSSDGTVSKLEKFLPKIKLIKSSENLGFSKGNNRAARQAKGEYLFFLNPDTEVKNPIFKQLVDFYQETPYIGIVAPRLVLNDGKTQASAKNLPTIGKAIQEFILGIKNSYSEYVPEENEPLEVEAVYGAAMLIRRDLFDNLEGFDEKYFLYYEDLDLCRKVRSIKRKIYYYPKAEIMHLVGATKSEENRYEINKDSFWKYHGFLEGFILQLIFLFPRLRRKL